MSDEMEWFPSPIMDEGNTIEYHFEDVEFEFSNSEKITNWILEIVKQESKNLSIVNIIFCSDQYLHKINVEYLDHDTYTDIVTFQYAELPQIEGDLFMSIERIKENAQSFKVPFKQELHRVIIHGILHLCGYGDKTDEDKKLMREKENHALSIFEKM